jgi:hypothetical protein
LGELTRPYGPPVLVAGAVLVAVVPVVPVFVPVVPIVPVVPVVLVALVVLIGLPLPLVVVFPVWQTVVGVLYERRKEARQPPSVELRIACRLSWVRVHFRIFCR